MTEIGLKAWKSSKTSVSYEENDPHTPKMLPKKAPRRGPKPDPNRAKMPLESRLDRDKPENVEILKNLRFLPGKCPPQAPNRAKLAPKSLPEAVLTEISPKA